MFSAFLRSTLTALLFLSVSVSAALQNVTIDDQVFSKITYSPASDWFHDPLIGWEYQFYNGSRSYTYVPGAFASFTFTGSGIYLQGPPAPDQARRRVFLDGQDMGLYDHTAPEREYCSVFYSATQLPYTTHTILVAHNDTSNLIFAMDAWIVEFDDTASILPYTTTTTTETAATHTITGAPTDGLGRPLNGTISGSPNTPDVNESAPKSYSTIIIEIVVPIVFLLLLCIVGIYIYHTRRTRSAQRRREYFREKFFRAGPIQLHSPLASTFGKQADGSGLAAVAARGGRDSDDSRAISPHSFASTRYSTALDHDYHSDQDHLRGRVSPVSPMNAAMIPPGNILDPRVLSAAINTDRNRSTLSITGTNVSSSRPLTATFDPPSEWHTRLTSAPEQATSVTRASEAHLPHIQDRDHTELSTPGASAATADTAAVVSTGVPRRFSRISQSGVDVYHALASNPKPLQSSALYETESTPPSPSAVRPNSQPPRSSGEGEPGLAPGGSGRPSSVLRRFSTAITSTLPFTRAGSRPNSRHSNGHTLSTPAGGNGSGAEYDATSTQHDEDLESNREPRSFFRGIGIPLNYRPTATASPTPPSPTHANAARVGRQSQNLRDLGFEDVWLGSRPPGSGVNTAPGRSTPPVGANPPVGSPFEDFAFSSYTRPTRERVLSLPTTTGGTDRTGLHPTPSTRAPMSSLDSSEGAVGVGGGGGGEMEPEEKDEKIQEALDGDTIRGDAEEDGRWSVGHGTLASQGTGGGVTRTGSLDRRQSIRSTTDQGRQVIPPPYSVYIPADTKASPPHDSE